MEGSSLRSRNTFVVQVRPSGPTTVENLLTHERVAVDGLTAVAEQLRTWLAASEETLETSAAELRAAVEGARRTGSAITLCEALLELGSAERLRGDLRTARDQLYEALALAEEHGAAGPADRARQELLAAGARPRRAASHGWEALTCSQARVADLVARGMSNREVAASLYLSEKTVEGHLRGVFRKLGIGSRVELASRVANRNEEGS